MYGLLGAALLALAAWLWLRRRVKRVRQWSELMGRAAQAEATRDLATATRLLDEADAVGAKGSGILWRMRLQAASYLRAHVEYRAGRLERAAQLAFEQLQQARAVT